MFAFVVLFVAFASATVVNQLAQHSNVGGAVSCTVCEVVMTGVIAAIGQNSTLADIAQDIDKACKLLPVLKAPCLVLGKLFLKLVGIIPSTLQRQQYTPYALCSMLDLCAVPCCVSNQPEQVQLALTANRAIRN